MKTIIWTVSSHGAQFERPSETKVFPTKREASQYMVNLIEDAGTRGFNMSYTKDSDGSNILKLYYDDNLMFVSIMKCHDINIDKR